jgi:hypothetical protein
MANRVNGIKDVLFTQLRRRDAPIPPRNAAMPSSTRTRLTQSTRIC